MTDLKTHLLSRIETGGPLSVADFMQECLLHPEFGYYARQDPFGASGDFITAPEISQMFGELIGLTLAQSWIDQGSPTQFILAELGPGRGTLMADIIRATKAVPGFSQAANVYLVEASKTLQAIQSEIVPTANHVSSVSSLPDDLPCFVVANEFFDALPIRQFVRQGDGWAERRVGEKDGDLIWGITPPQDIEALSNRLADTQDGDLVEISVPAAAIVSDLSKKVSDNGGLCLFIDYGDWHSLGDTFQAIAEHKSVDPLANPGSADLTAHVDFEALAAASAPLVHSKLSAQGVFLERLGITERAKMLASRLSGDALNNHIAAHRRLTHPDEMGTLFKVLGLKPENAPNIAGLEF